MAKIDFSHKVVLLTGASGGIGAGIARRLCGQGAQLVLSGRSLGDLQRLIGESPPGHAAGARGVPHVPLPVRYLTASRLAVVASQHSHRTGSPRLRVVNRR